MLNLQNSFKLVKFFQIWVYPGISEGRGSLDLTSHYQMTMPGLGPLDWRRGFTGVILALMQMWEPDEMPCVPKFIHPGVSWTKITLAACSGGFLTWRGPWRGATGAHGCTDPDDTLFSMYPVCCDGNLYVLLLCDQCIC